MLPILVHKGKSDFSIATRFEAQCIIREAYEEEDTPHTGHLRGSASEVDSAASCGGKFPSGSARRKAAPHRTTTTGRRSQKAWGRSYDYAEEEVSLRLLSAGGFRSCGVGMGTDYAPRCGF